MTHGSEYLVSVEAHPGNCPNCLGNFNRHSGYRDDKGELFCSEDCAHGRPIGTLLVSDGITCSAIVDPGEDSEEDIGPCGKPSRFQVARSDGDETCGINGGSDEACGEHLAETVAGMIEGDVGIAAIVTIRWDT